MEAVQKGLANYIDKNLLSQMQPSEKVIKGGLIGIYLNGLPKLIDGYINKTGLDKIGIVTEQGVDIDVIKDSYINQFQDGVTLPVEVPFIGTLTFDKEEVEKIYQEIINANY